MTNKIIDKIENSTTIAIIRNVSSNRLIPLTKAIFDGNIKLFMCNYAFNISNEETANNIKVLKEYFGDEITIGAGGVTEKNQIALTKKAGGQFIFLPNSNSDMTENANKLNLVSIVRAPSHSQIISAIKSGADFAQTFPINAFDMSSPSIRLLKLGKNSSLLNKDNHNIEELYKTLKKVKLDIIDINL